MPEEPVNTVSRSMPSAMGPGPSVCCTYPIEPDAIGPDMAIAGRAAPVRQRVSAHTNSTPAHSRRTELIRDITIGMLEGDRSHSGPETGNRWPATVVT